MIKVLAFDLFGTVFDLSGTPRSEIKAYSDHIRKPEWSPLVLPESWIDLPLFPDALEGLNKLQERYSVIVASNAPAEFTEQLMDKHDLPFNGVVDFASQRVFKPHYKSYDVIATHYNIPSNEYLMITANKDFGDIAGAIHAGMSSQLIRHGYPNTIIELAALLTAP